MSSFRIALAPSETVASGKVLHFIRHGQGFHNVAFLEMGSTEAYKDWRWVDSRLTAVGEAQAKELRSRPMWSTAQLVVVSPLSRAIKTGLLARPEDLKLPYIATELLRERIGTHPCDHRRSKTELAADFPLVDFSLLSAEEDPYWTEEREPWEDLVGRALAFLEFIMARPEREVVVVTHNDFLEALLRDSPVTMADPAIRAIRFSTAESYSFHVDQGVVEKAVDA